MRSDVDFFMWFVALHFTQRLAMLNIIYYKHTGITYVTLKLNQNSELCLEIN